MKRRAEMADEIARGGRSVEDKDPTCGLKLPSEPYEEKEQPNSTTIPMDQSVTGTNAPPADLVAGLTPLKDHKILVMGVASDILFPAWQQREIAETLRAAGSKSVEHIELGEDVSLFGHDTFLLDTENIGGSVGRFLE